MNDSCLRVGWERSIAEYDSSDVAAIFLMSFWLAVLVAPVVLWLYQRRVEKLMSVRAAGGEQDPQQASEATEPGTAPATGFAPSLEAPAILEAMDLRMGKAHRAMASAAVVFALAAALVIGVAAMFLENPEDLGSLRAWAQSLAYGLVLATCAAAPVAMMDSPGRYRRMLLLVPFTLLIGLLVSDIAFDTSMSVRDRATQSAAGAIAIALLYLALTGRRLRNVVPLLTLFLATLVSAMYIPGILVEMLDACESRYPDWLGAPLLIGTMWALVWLGMRLLRKLTEAYEQQTFSDSQLQIGLWFLVIVILLAIQTTPDDDDVMFSAWSLGILVAAGGAVLVYVRQLASQARWASPQPMLLLRVFSSRRDTQDLLDEVTYRWSFIGPIHLVGGPDLAKTYLEPHELLLFLRRKMRQQFVRSRQDLMRRLDELEDQPDSDGRYRINEFFCLDNTWQLTVEHLVGLAPVILLDLRGFDGSRAGTAFEVTLVARADALHRTVFLYDRHTDDRAVNDALAEVTGARIAQERIVHLDRSPDSTSVLQLLASPTASNSVS